MVKKVEIELPFGSDPMHIFCPACGKNITEDDICEHTIFTYLDVINEFMSVSDKYKEIAKSIDENEDCDDKVEEFIKHLEGECILLLTVVSSGMSCGPTSSAVTACIDFDL